MNLSIWILGREIVTIAWGQQPVEEAVEAEDEVSPAFVADSQIERDTAFGYAPSYEEDRRRVR